MGPMIGGCLAAKLYKDNFRACDLERYRTSDGSYRRVTSPPPEPPAPESRSIMDDVDGDTNTLERTTTI